MADTGLAEALSALRPRGTRSRGLVIGAVSDDDAWGGPPVRALKDRDVAKALRGKTPPKVVVCTEPSPTLVRALREAPPPLLVVLGVTDPELDGVAGLHVLGPGAVLRLGDGEVIACATGRGELEGLCRTLGPRLRLGLCPTPRWFCELLGVPELEDKPVAGYVHANALHGRWAAWSRNTAAQHVLVPVGLSPLGLDDAESDDVATAAAAHTLERFTGPVFPASRVIGLVLDGLVGKRKTELVDGADDAGRAMWAQARRALPLDGAAVGMEEPGQGLPLSAPTAAFLAQRALLRARAAIGLKVATRRPKVDAEGIERAAEVLRGAGQTLTDQESKVVLRGFGVDVTRQAVANSASGAAGFGERIGFPVVLKALSPDLRRRAEIGAVVLDLRTSAAVRRAFTTIVDNVEKRAPTARLDGVLVAEMLGGGLDVRCGGMRLPDGAVVLYGQAVGTSLPLEPVFGLGGLTPLDSTLLAHAILSRVPVPALRRHTDPDVRGLAELLLRLDALMDRMADRILAVDLGPVRLTGPPRGAVTLDARITQRPHLEGR